MVPLGAEGGTPEEGQGLGANCRVGGADCGAADADAVWRAVGLVGMASWLKGDAHEQIQRVGTPVVGSIVTGRC